jgi:hypothetical protein
VLLSNIGHRINTVPYIPKELFLKYYSIAFAILPGIAGGLALELQIYIPIESYMALSRLHRTALLAEK